MEEYRVNITGPTILLIDSAHTLRRSCYQPNMRELSNSIGTPTGGVYGYFNSLRSVTGSLMAQSIVICHEGGHSERRKEVYSDYKKRDTGKEEARDIHGYTDYEFYKHQLSWIETILDNMGIPQLRVSGKEGDDVIFQASRLLKGKKVIVSEDSDFLSLVSEDIAIYRPIKKLYIDLVNFKEETGFTSPKHYLYYKVLRGDGSDNIPGICKGVGSKTITDILEKIENPDDLSPDEVVKVASTFKAARYRKVIDAGVRPIIRNLDLIDISRETFNIFELEKLAEDLSTQRYINVSMVRKLLSNLEFNPYHMERMITTMSNTSSFSLAPFIDRGYIKRVMMGSTSALQG